MSSLSFSKPWAYRLAGALLCLLPGLALLPGCGLLGAPKQMVNAVMPAGKNQQPDPIELQTEIQRFTDDFSSQTAYTLDEYARAVGTRAAQALALQLKLQLISAVTSIASGPNPNMNLLDLVSTVTFNRMAIQDYWMKTTNGAAFEPWSKASRQLETDVWRLAGIVLKPEQVKELRLAIQQCYDARTSGERKDYFARPQDFAAMVVRTQQKKGVDLNSVFSLVDLDPMSSLDPAVREVTRTRLFAERAMFTFQRMPFLVRWQTELLAFQLTAQPDVQRALTNTAQLGEGIERISWAADRLSQTAAELPDRIADERKAILDAMTQQEGRLRELAVELNRTMMTGEKMSTSLNTTITTFDALMKRFGVGEPGTNPVSDTNSPPFNILDYGEVAGKVGAMAKDLNALIASVDQSVPQIERLSQKATADAEGVVNRAFRLGLLLILVLLTGAVVAALTYRVLEMRLTARHLAKPVGSKINSPPTQGLG
jgi:hypothetical protein